MWVRHPKTVGLTVSNYDLDRRAAHPYNNIFDYPSSGNRKFQDIILIPSFVIGTDAGRCLVQGWFSSLSSSSSSPTSAGAAAAVTLLFRRVTENALPDRRSFAKQMERPRLNDSIWSTCLGHTGHHIPSQVQQPPPHTFNQGGE
ncbi:uncharacterized protein LOC134767499 [Penaeus indicus]|uniref:uncharacterized protein LOC134767499 n=1 Tax=Penaeus indicus TaxID=29960 RepID=UPI00300D8228